MHFNKRYSILISAASILIIASIYYAIQMPLNDYLSFNSIARHRILSAALPISQRFASQQSGLLGSLTEIQGKFCMGRGLRIKVLGHERTSNPSTYPETLCQADNNLRKNSTAADWATCFRTRIDESIFDVFVLDYYDTADESLVELADRIRRRFPAAIIVNLKHWYPDDIGYPGTYGWTSASQWANTHGHSSMKDSMEDFLVTTLPWERLDNPTLEQYWQTATQKSGAWNLFKGTESEKDLPAGKEFQTILERRQWMYDGWNVRNEYGDFDVARGVFDLFEYLDAKRNSTVSDWIGNDDPSSCFL